MARQPCLVFARDRNHALEECVIRSQYVSASTARQGGRRFLPGVGVHEGTPPGPAAARRRFSPRDADDGQVVLTDGMPARAAFLIIWQMSSICRSRWILREQMAGFSLREISLELSGSGTMESVTPNDSTRSRRRLSPSTDHAPSIFADGSRLQMCVTPKPASTRRMASSRHAGSPLSSAPSPSAPRDGWLRRDFGRHQALRNGVGRHAASDRTHELGGPSSNLTRLGAGPPRPRLSLRQDRRPLPGDSA